jgi:hypothetical protein
LLKDVYAMKSPLFAAVVGIGLFSQAPLFAQDGPPPSLGGRMLERLDADGDGKITRAEFDAEAAQRFARMDRNGDGVVDAAELKDLRDRFGGRGRGPDPR